MKIMVTGGAGFIGSNLVKYIINNTDYEVVVVDKLTYAGNLLSLKDLSDNERYSFEKDDICNKNEMQRILHTFRPNAIMHLAAESHVDRSIYGPFEFINTNIVGTYNLLEASREYYNSLSSSEKKEFRFLHVSTDEVYGSLGEHGFFTEETPYDPSSPYSASKASSDHLARAWQRTFGVPTLVTNCSNNYGPYQFPEKLIPVVILKALDNRQIPVYGKGDNVRDWLFVEDHTAALFNVIKNGKVGCTYNIGGNNEKTNIEIVKTICTILDEIKPREEGNYSDLITFVSDRPGHDKRYAIDASKIKNELGFLPKYTFESGIRKTVEWYVNNNDWCKAVIENKYSLERLGAK